MPFGYLRGGQSSDGDLASEDDLASNVSEKFSCQRFARSNMRQWVASVSANFSGLSHGFNALSVFSHSARSGFGTSPNNFDNSLDTIPFGETSLFMIVAPHANATVT